MKRSQLAHLLRAAGTHLQCDKFIVVGSAALLGSYPESLVAATVLFRSMEADLVPPDFDDATADKIDGAFGELSQFQRTHGMFADGVSLETATPPSGWQHRLVPFAPEAANGIIGWCLEPHDLVIAKLEAGRHKDIEFATEMVQRHLVKKCTLIERATDRTIGAVARLPKAAPGFFEAQLDVSGIVGEIPSPPQIPHRSSLRVLEADLTVDRPQRDLSL